MRRWHFTEGNKSEEKSMQKYQKVWQRALAIVESGTGQTTKHESAAQMWQSLSGRKANQHLLSWRMSHRQGCRQQQEEAVPYNTIHSLCLCTPPEHITPSSLQTISPCTQPEEQSSREHGGEPCHGFSLAGTGSSWLCLTGLGCFLPSLQPQGPKAQSRQWAPWWHQHQQQGEHSPSGDLQAFQIGRDRYRTELQRFGQWGWLIWAAKIIWCYSSWNGSFTQKVQNTENKGKEKTWEGSGSWYSKVLRSPSIQLDW